MMAEAMAWTSKIDRAPEGAREQVLAAARALPEGDPSRLERVIS